MEFTLGDATKAAFLSGYSPETWLGLIRDTKHTGSPTHAASEICNAVFTLLEAYPLSPVLLQYLCVALDSTQATAPAPILPIGVYIAALIARSQSMLANHASALNTDQNAQTLAALCAIAAPRAQKPNAHLAPTLPTAQGCISLVQHVHMHHAHNTDFIAATLDILIALLQTVVATPPNPNLSPVLALHLVPTLDDFLNGPMAESVSRPLTSWLFQLSALTTESAPHAPKQGSASTDEPAGGPVQRPELLEFTWQNIALFDVLAYELARALAHKDDHISALQAVFNIAQPNLEDFYFQLYTSLFATLAAENDQNTRILIRATIFGSLPVLLRQLEAQVESHLPLPKLREALQAAVSRLFTNHSALLDKCDTQSYSTPLVHARDDTTEEDTHGSDVEGKNIRTMLVQSLQSVALLHSNHTAAAALGLENWPGHGTGRLFIEAAGDGQDLEGYMKLKLSSETPIRDGLELIDRAVVDPETHACLCSVLRKSYFSLIGSAQHMSSITLEALAHLSRLLYTHPTVLNIFSLRVPPSELVAAGLAFLDDPDYAGGGDPQSALGHYGDVVLLLQLLISRYELRDRIFKYGERLLDASYLVSSWAVYNVVDLADPERALVSNWVKAVFDNNSHGIDDHILRATNPQTLLKLCATLFTEAIRKYAESEVARKDILRNGVSYFEGPLLKWTLRGVVLALANEAERHGHAARTHLEILHHLILASGCPPPVLEMTRHRVLRLLASSHVPKANLDVNAMMRVLEPLPVTGSATSSGASVLHPAAYLNLAIQNLSISIAISGSVPVPIPNPSRLLPFATPLALLRAPVHEVANSIAHRNVLIALLTLSRPRFAALRYLLAGSVGGVGGAVGTGMDSDLFTGVVAGAFVIWLATPGERTQAQAGIKRFVKECEQDKGGEGIAHRLMGLDYVRACMASP